MCIRAPCRRCRNTVYTYRRRMMRHSANRVSSDASTRQRITNNTYFSRQPESMAAVNNKLTNGRRRLHRSRRDVTVHSAVAETVRTNNPDFIRLAQLNRLRNNVAGMSVSFPVNVQKNATTLARSNLTIIDIINFYYWILKPQTQSST